MDVLSAFMAISLYMLFIKWGLEEDLSPVPAARITCNSSRKGRKDAKGAKGREDKGEESRNRFPNFSCVHCPRKLLSRPLSVQASHPAEPPNHPVYP